VRIARRVTEPIMNLHLSSSRSLVLPLALAAAAALAPAAHAAGPLTLTIQQLTHTGPECTGGGSYYPSIDSTATMMAFTSWCDLVHGKNTDGNSELFVRKTDGTGLKQLTHTVGGVGSMEPSISSDGTLIVFASSADLVPGGNTDGNNEIYLIHADGTGLVQLTSTTGGRTADGFPGNTHPILDPSASHIVFSSDRDLVPGGNADGNNDLFEINVDGTGLRQLTFTTGGWGVNQGSLDGTGTRLVFDSDRDLVTGQNTDAGYEIFTMNTDGSHLVQLTHSASSDTQVGNLFPRWTSDGASIFFASDMNLTGGSPSANYEVYQMAGDGSSIVQVTSCVGDFGAVPWGIGLQGRAVSIESDCDFVPGANLDRNGELFLETWKPAQFPAAPPAARVKDVGATRTAAAVGARRMIPPMF
jgi:Tol biopolymer transport system component